MQDRRRVVSWFTSVMAWTFVGGGVLGADGSTPFPPLSPWSVQEGGKLIRPIEGTRYQGVNLSDRLSLQHVLQAPWGRPNEQGAVVVQATRVSRHKTGAAATQVFFNKIDADRPLGPESNPDDPRSVSVEEFALFHQGQQVSRHTQRLLRNFFHTTLAVRGGTLHTEDTGSLFSFVDPDEDPARLVRTVTILRFFAAPGYPLTFSTGRFGADFVRVYYRISALNYDVPPVELILER